MDPDARLLCSLTGFRLQLSSSGTLELHQQHYVNSFSTLPEDALFSAFSSMPMKMAWLAHSRPDCLYEISQLAQTTFLAYHEGPTTILKSINRLIQYAKQNRVSLRFPPLDLSTIHVVCYNDISFGINHDHTSHLAHISLLADGSGSFVPVNFRSYKGHRVTRSVMAAELIVFADAFEASFNLTAELRKLLDQPNLPLTLLTDSKILFDVISKGWKTSEKRLMLDIAAAREEFRIGSISDIDFI